MDEECKEQWQFLIGKWLDCKQRGKSYVVNWARGKPDSLSVKMLRGGKGDRGGINVVLTYDKPRNLLVWPAKRKFTLCLDDCGESVRWRYQDTGEAANEWKQEPVSRAPLDRKRRLEEDRGLSEPEELASDDILDSPELDKSQVFFQIVTCGKDRFKDHHMQEQAIVFDVRDFHDPGAGELKHHDGRHDEIITRIRQHGSFASLVASLRRRIRRAVEGSPWPGLHQDRVLLQVGRHRSVALARSSIYILLYENFRNTKLEHEGNFDGFVCCQCGRCRCRTALRLQACEDALREWKRRRPSAAA
ncbi:PSR1 [Symbiodinium natans]|uniref:PSR1 protein n=1 Tax=Symbiodinium natans TaxID=878477 RepID=A0A812NHU0_9DINO|nr:PSR1 [Symbiodinium natans]